jgi:hypothetical protein
MAFAHIYTCPVHGETINVTIVEDVDCDNDEVYEVPIHNKADCYREVRPLMVDGKHVMRPLTKEEIQDEIWAAGLEEEVYDG